MQPTPRDIISTWAALIDAAQSGDAEARAFLRMFEPVAAEALGWADPTLRKDGAAPSASAPGDGEGFGQAGRARN